MGKKEGFTWWPQRTGSTSRWDEIRDAAFPVTVLGEVPDAAACVVQLRDALGRGGLLSITELAGDPDAMTEGDIAAFSQSRESRTLRDVHEALRLHDQLQKSRLNSARNGCPFEKLRKGRKVW